VRSGRAGFVVLAWPCGDPDILPGDGEINLNFNGGRVSAERVGTVGPCGAWVRSLAWWHGWKAVPFPFAPRRTL